MRKVKCDRKKGSCWLEPAPLSQIGRGGGLVPVAVDYVIPLRKTSSKTKKPMTGGGHKKRKRKKTAFSRSKVTRKRTTKKKRKKNYGDFEI